MSIQVFETQLICRVGPRQTSVSNQNAILFQNEGSDLGAYGDVSIIDFVGAGVDVVKSGTKLTVTITSGGGGGSGDVTGPSGATDDNIATYNGATGKIIKDGGTTIAAILALIALKANATSVFSIKFLTGDITNNNAVANTLENITGLNFTPVVGKKYAFKAVLPYTTATTTTGSRVAINGPTATDFYAVISVASSVSGEQFRYVDDYETGPLSANSSSEAMVATIYGVIQCSSDASDVQLRFASEVSGSAVTMKAGGYLEYLQLD